MAQSSSKVTPTRCSPTQETPTRNGCWPRYRSRRVRVGVVKMRRLSVAALVLALTIAGCSSGDQKPPPAGGEAEVGTTSDQNPQDPATLRQGGNLRLPLTEFPANFNS